MKKLSKMTNEELAQLKREVTDEINKRLKDLRDAVTVFEDKITTTVRAGMKSPLNSGLMDQPAVELAMNNRNNPGALQQQRLPELICQACGYPRASSGTALAIGGPRCLCKRSQ